MSEFDQQSVYNKHQPSCDCEDKSSCSCSVSECGCCPPGLVSVKNSSGDISCLTPNDAACLEIESTIPPAGYMKLYYPGTRDFIGIVTTQEALDFIAAIDPDVDAPSEGDDYNITTQDSVALVAPPDTETRTGAVTYSLDRISCDESATVTLSSPPSGVSFLGGATSLLIPSGASELTDGIEITDEIDAGVYNITVLYDACGNAKTKTLILNVS